MGSRWKPGVEKENLCVGLTLTIRDRRNGFELWLKERSGNRCGSFWKIIVDGGKIWFWEMVLCRSGEGISRGEGGKLWL